MPAAAFQAACSPTNYLTAPNQTDPLPEIRCRSAVRADIPVVQLSIDETQASYHFGIGERLAPLREEGMLVVGSNLVHNLHAYAWGRHTAAPFDWAVKFEQQAREMILAGEHQPLVNYERLGREARLSIPTPDH